MPVKVVWISFLLTLVYWLGNAVGCASSSGDTQNADYQHLEHDQQRKMFYPHDPDKPGAATRHVDIFYAAYQADTGVSTGAGAAADTGAAADVELDPSLGGDDAMSDPATEQLDPADPLDDENITDRPDNITAGPDNITDQPGPAIERQDDLMADDDLIDTDRDPLTPGTPGTPGSPGSPAIRDADTLGGTTMPGIQSIEGSDTGAAQRGQLPAADSAYHRDHWKTLRVAPARADVEHGMVLFHHVPLHHEDRSPRADMTIDQQINAAYDGLATETWNRQSAASLVVQPVKFGLDLIAAPIRLVTGNDVDLHDE